MKKHIDTSRQLLEMNIYPDYETLREIINVFVQRYEMLSVTSIGETTLGKSIYMVDIGVSDAANHVLYVASHSATDYVTTMVLLRFINEYCEYYKSSSVAFGINIRNLFQNNCIHIVPCINSDGVEIHLNGINESCILYDRIHKMSGGEFSKWKANARGVDLNYNYDSGFYSHKGNQILKGVEAGASEFSGIAPESENETGALANYLRFNDKIKAVLSLETGGEKISYRSGDKSPKGAFSIAKQMQVLSGYSVEESISSVACGSLRDWCIEELGIPAFSIRCGAEGKQVAVSDFYKIYSELRRALFSFPVLI